MQGQFLETADQRFDGVLCFGGVDWWYHNRAHSDAQIMRQLATKLRVLFVNSLGMRMPLPGRSTQPGRRILRKLGSIARGLRKVDEQMWVFTPIMLPPSRNRKIRAINARLIACQIRMALKMAGIRRCFTWVTVPTACDVLRFLPRTVTVFNRSDVFSEFPEVCGEFIRCAEAQLLQDSDLVLYVNRNLMAKDPGDEGRKYYLGHGVDYEAFRQAGQNRSSIHPGLAGIKRPIVGFFGAIDDYTIDLELLRFAAEALPDMSFVLIGLSTVDISRITALGNVHYLGFRAYAEIPRLGAAFDVAIMPWLQNEWIANCNPVKLKEYLALGLPIVTTPIPQAEEYAGLLTVAGTPEQFVEAIRSCAAGDSEQARLRRQEAVKKDCWQNKAEQVLTLVRKLGYGPRSG
jgi:glycosyltransferase involved in cell wall biosynthesis